MIGCPLLNTDFINSKDDNGEKAVLEKLEAVTKQIKTETSINRIGVLLKNKYNPKSFDVSVLKGPLSIQNYVLLSP